jgi:hypothetical protein
MNSPKVSIASELFYARIDLIHIYEVKKKHQIVANSYLFIFFRRGIKSLAYKA